MEGFRVPKKQVDTLDLLVKSGQVTPYGWQYISTLCKTVAYRYYRTYDVEDLISMATIDLADFLLLIESGDNIPRSIRNVLFTRARNSMSNYLYHRRKTVPTEDEILDLQVSKEYAVADIIYNYTTIEEAHLLSLKLWRYYEGSRENADRLEKEVSL
jgi:hypothetical protein